MAVTRVHTIPNPGVVQVSPQRGEFLFFRVQAKGPVPRFQFSTDIKGLLLRSARPVILSGSGEASKDPDREWLVRAQAKLTVPIMTGVEIPISYTYANRDAEGNTSGSQLKMSLSVDPVRLRERFR
jgi:hypothetical protein